MLIIYQAEHGPAWCMHKHKSSKWPWSGDQPSTSKLLSLTLWLQMYYLNPVSWTLYGLVASNVGDVNSLITLNGSDQAIPVTQFLRERFDYRHDFLGWVVLILLGWIVVLWMMGAYAFKRFNFQKR